MDDELPPLLALLEATRLIVPDALPAILQTLAQRFGAHAAVLYLVDLDQRWLVPLAPPGPSPFEEMMIEGTLAGRSFRASDILEARSERGDTTVWVPVLDGMERLGVLQLTFGGVVPTAEEMKAFAGLVAELVMSKRAYGDFFELARRRQPLTVGSELLWQLLPPLTFATQDLVIAAAFTPTERLGGDVFDYGVDYTSAQVAIFDAVGHDLEAGLLATTAVAAFRNARRSRLPLQGTAAHIGTAIGDHFDGSKFVTGIVTSLDIATGRFSWCVAGHPAPLLLRNGRVVKRLDNEQGQPFGVGPASEMVAEQLEPGDRILLYTDGVVEARNRGGEFFELEKLIDLVSRTSERDPPPETMRLLMHAIEAHNDGPIRDDATVVLVEWRGAGGQQLEV